MQLVSDYFLIITQNLLLSSLLGIPSVIQSAGSRRKLLLNGLMTAGFCALNNGLIGVIRGTVPMTEPVWMLLCSVAVAAASDIFALFLLSLPRRPEIRRVIPQVHLAAFSGAVLGLMLKSGAVSFGAGFRFGLQSGSGYLLACAMLAAVLPVVNSEKVPASVRGWRGLLMYTGVLAMAVSCFAQNAG